MPTPLPFDGSFVRGRRGFVRVGAVVIVVVLLAVIPLLWPKPPASGSGSGATTCPPSAVEPSTRSPAVEPNADPGGETLQVVAVAELPAEVVPGRTAADAPAGGSAPKTSLRPQPPEPESVEETADEKHRKLVLGKWSQYDHGPRVLTLNEDGTGLMVVEPAGAWAYALGAKVTIETEWTIENGRAIFKSVRGKPESSFKAITQLFGRERNREILELSEKKLVLLDNDDGSKSEWTRVE